METVNNLLHVCEHRSEQLKTQAEELLDIIILRGGTIHAEDFQK